MLSQIERGLSSPSLKSLTQICAALGIPLSWLFALIFRLMDAPVPSAVGD
ncbi:MAG: helix-turn-helix transcriptional regulator [Polaromonas sp.]|nr:helix-turn-helix transcriptional regulator [Polaromonas sp.]